ncbi:hypothetical protein [Fredinandcohnia onubensis]|uniref:hypothetical protein n=1 Tax=Fredinandcohnia onubensis TaxID=1571209 RepID=UPI000C0C095D|nr:hypothetical protein [Fredinandcohnia onubensis]
MKVFKQRWLLFIVFFTILLLGMLLINLWLSPGGSISLYQKVSNSDYNDFSDLLTDEYKDRFSKDEFNEIKHALDSNTPYQISEYTVIKSKDSWILINKSPDGKNEILGIEIVNKDKVANLEELFK